MGVRYLPEMKKQIEGRIIRLYETGYNVTEILRVLDGENFKNADGTESIELSYIRTSVTRLKKDGSINSIPESEPDEEPIAYVEVEEPEEIEIDLPQIVFDCLVAEDLNNNQKIGIIKSYYEI